MVVAGRTSVGAVARVPSVRSLAPAWAGPKAGWLGRVPGLAPSLGWPKAGPFGLPPSLEPGLAGSEAGLPGKMFFPFYFETNFK